MKTVKKTVKANAQKARGTGRPRNRAGDDRRRFAKLYDTDAETIRNWERLGAPLTDKKAMDVWIASRKDNGVTFADCHDLQSAKLAKLNIETKRIAFRLEAERGEYTPNSEVVRQATACAERSRAEWMALINELPTWAGLSPAEMQDKAKQLVNRVLARLHD